MKIYSFGLNENTELTSAEVLGGKGAGLVWMTNEGISVPPGFILPTSVCLAYLKKPEATMKAVEKAIKPYLKKLEGVFGYMPLLSVRSGARASMPGMMDTILNVGLDINTVSAWDKRIGPDAMRDSYCRLVEMYGSVVKGIDKEKFKGLNIQARLARYMQETGEQFPDAHDQILGSIEAVFKSWNNERAVFYRNQNKIPHNWGTAVTVQAMVFGNMNEDSATGVLNTRNALTGEPVIQGEYLPNAQGEDVVAGIRTGQNILLMNDWNMKIATELRDTVEKLEKAKKAVQDVEFTVQNGNLFILQTRNAKLSAKAIIKVAVDMAAEGLITQKEALERVSFKTFLKAQEDVIDPTWAKENPPTYDTGIAACNGVATGQVVLSAKAAIECSGPTILVTQETCPDDIQGMAAARGVLTMTGGATCHAAVVARGMNKPCVVGLSIPLEHFKEGQRVTIDGATGRVWFGEAPVISGANNPSVAALLAIMCNVSGYHLEGGEVLNLSGYLNDPVGARKVVKEAIQNHTEVVVDVRQPKSLAHKAYAEMFGNPDLLEEEYFLANSFQEIPGVKVVTNANLGDKAQRVPQADNLVEVVLATGTFILEGGETPAIRKVLNYRETAGESLPLILGETGKGKVYLSPVQLAHHLLPAV